MIELFTFGLLFLAALLMVIMPIVTFGDDVIKIAKFIGKRLEKPANWMVKNILKPVGACIRRISNSLYEKTGLSERLSTRTKKRLGWLFDVFACLAILPSSSTAAWGITGLSMLFEKKSIVRATRLKVLYDRAFRRKRREVCGTCALVKAT